MPGMFAARVLAILLVLLLPCFAGAQQPAPAKQEAAKQRAQGQESEAQRQLTQPLNNAPYWRDVRGGDKNPYQTTQVRGIETSVLIQNEGEVWRRIRNGPIIVYGGWVLVLVIVSIALFYWRRGKITLHEPRTGRNILRFTPWERTVHWATAISFVILAVSGLLMLFGKYVLLPLFGYTVFSVLAIFSKNLHNFIGPLFAICTVVMFVTYAKDNVPQRGDWLWLRKFGGLVSGKHVPSWRFNAGEKIWFWLGVCILGVIVSATGFILDFPNFEQGRSLMQQTIVVHSVAALIFAALSLGHIYLGTIGMEGSYDTMRHGIADETWAKEHHEYWYNEVVGNRERAAATGVAPKAAPASSMKEGWKL